MCSTAIQQLLGTRTINFNDGMEANENSSAKTDKHYLTDIHNCVNQVNVDLIVLFCVPPRKIQIKQKRYME